MQSFKRVNDDPNPSCPICTDDSKWIFSVTVRDFSTFTLGDLVDRVFHGEWSLSQVLVEHNNDIMYEEGDGEEDIEEDEGEIYERRKKRALAEIKVRDMAILQVHGVMGGKEVKVYVQIDEDRGIKEEYVSKKLKMGGIKKEIP